MNSANEARDHAFTHEGLICVNFSNRLLAMRLALLLLFLAIEPVLSEVHTSRAAANGNTAVASQARAQLRPIRSLLRNSNLESGEIGEVPIFLVGVVIALVFGFIFLIDGLNGGAVFRCDSLGCKTRETVTGAMIVDITVLTAVAAAGWKSIGNSEAAVSNPQTVQSSRSTIGQRRQAYAPQNLFTDNEPLGIGIVPPATRSVRSDETVASKSAEHN